jgi:hypothetical protein
MLKRVALFVFLFVASGLVAQTNQDESQRPPKVQERQVTVLGCVSRSTGGHYILTQSGNTAVLEAAPKINLDQYLGQQVEVTGNESTTLGTSSTAVSSGAAGPKTIMVDSINSISERCTH